jgi:SAM-dependent methyltransferase
MKKLNFGCGSDIQNGWDNVDVQVNKRITKSFDFDKFPYPIKGNIYDYIFINNVLEHLNEPDKVLNELWRISKNGGVIKIIVPYYNNKGAFSDMQHKHYFSDVTFEVFVNKVCKVDKKKLFKMESMRLIPTKVGRIFSARIRKKLSLFFGGVISQVHVKLRVIK